MIYELMGDYVIYFLPGSTYYLLLGGKSVTILFLKEMPGYEQVLLIKMSLYNALSLLC